VPKSQPQALEPVLDDQNLVERLMGDRELACRILRRFVADTPRQLVLLAEAVQGADAAAAHRAAHALKGAAANAGGARLSDTARRIEALAKTGDLAGAAKLLAELLGQFESFRAQAEDFANAPG